MNSIEGKVLVVSHDSGGAEIVSAWVKKYLDINKVDFCLKGPAQKIFLSKMNIENNLTEQDVKKRLENNNDCTWNTIITGTSWEDLLELRILKKVKDKPIKTITYLDHWQNHRERFGFPREDWIQNLADEIWCGDEYCLKICERLGFPKERLKFVENEYYHEIAQLAETYKGVFRKNSILYLCEPIAEHTKIQYGDELYLGYNEYTALQNFKEKLFEITSDVELITVRLHPSEKIDKYNKFVKENLWPCPITVSEGNTLLDDILSHEWIVGCETMAMVIALKLGKKVVSIIPEKGRTCILPFNEIKHLR